MSQHITRYKIIFLIILTSLALVFTLAGCQDDPIYKPEEIPDAEVEIRGEVIFRPLVPTEVKTRAEAPDAEKYKGLKSLYIVFFNSEGKLMEEYSGDVDFTPAPSEGSTHEHATFKKKVRAGSYYVYAVANMSALQKTGLKNITSVDELRKFKLDWDDNIENDLEMFGVFRQNNTEGTPGNEDFETPGNEDFETDELVTITPKQSSLHSWVRRAVSKVTVDFNGKNLKDGVTVYIKNATLKDVASKTLLGTASAVDGEQIKCVSSNYSISYGSGESYSSWPSVTNATSFSPANVWGNPDITSFHDDNAKALPCYENMQGEPEGKSKLQDRDGDGIIDSEIKDGVDNGTYLEVEGYYVADRPEYKSNGKIIYRFMLGKDAVRNFDLVRNHHYKITMQFKDYGNDVDWHIEYAEKYLDVTYPQDVNYKGEFFEPNHDYNAYHNAGHKFDTNNKIIVTSYSTLDGKTKTWIEPDDISYTYYKHDDKTDGWILDNTTSNWLTLNEGDVSSDKSHKEYTYVASMSPMFETTIDNLFPNAKEGDENDPYNLSSSTGGITVENTANCYMVGAPGWYCFPLVYGNAISGGGDNAAAYSSPHIVNHVNKKIEYPYILDNFKNEKGDITLTNLSVKLIWQDAENLIDAETIEYVPGLFGGHGGIKFAIGTIQEGNAVIALIDNNAKKEDDEDKYIYLDRGEYGTSGSTKAIWSWHIWVTRFGSDNFEKTIRILNHEEKEFEMMPINLGWCSGGQTIRYHRRRKCDIVFKFGDREIIRTIEQYPHFAVPRGDHPYYQWGRKDPFVGSNALWQNKVRWIANGTGLKKLGTEGKYNPPRLYNEPDKQYTQDNRKTTTKCLNMLIQNPDKWHNSTRAPKLDENGDVLLDKDGNIADFYSTNISYDDLWSFNGYKTIYDPCPPGYQVGDNTIFTGFTTSGGNAKFPTDWYDVLEKDMSENYYDTSSGYSVNRQVIEFYTDKSKVQSVSFPVSGYRDYDGKAEVVRYPDLGKNEWGEGFVWTNMAKDATNSYHLKFKREDMWDNELSWLWRGVILAPKETFYNTDGFAVRPVRIVNK